MSRKHLFARFSLDSVLISKSRFRLVDIYSLHRLTTSKRVASYGLPGKTSAGGLGEASWLSLCRNLSSSDRFFNLRYSVGTKMSCHFAKPLSSIHVAQHGDRIGLSFYSIFQP